jgi:hypothetical protein
MTDARMILQAARLIHYTLDGRAQPLQETEYAQLLSEYSADPEFRAIVDATLTGLGLGPDPHPSRFGFALEPDARSVFHFNLAEFRRGNVVDTTETKLLWGLAFLGIAAYLYPRPENLDEPAERTVDAQDVDAMLRGVARDLRKQGGDGDPVQGEGEPLWRLYDRKDADARGTRGSLKQGCTQWFIDNALRFLEARGFLRATGPSSSGRERRYRTQPRFRHQLRTVAAQRALEAVLVEPRTDLGLALLDEEAGGEDES